MSRPTGIAQRAALAVLAVGGMLVLASCGGGSTPIVAATEPASTEAPDPPRVLSPESELATGAPSSSSQPVLGQLMGSEQGTAYAAPGSALAPTLRYEVEYVDLAVRGALSEATVLRRLLQARDDVKACLGSAYEARGSTGAVTLRLNVNGDGGVTGIEQTGDTTGDEELATCVRNLIRRLPFGRADGLSFCTVTVDLQVTGSTVDGAPRPDPEPPAQPPSGTP